MFSWCVFAMAITSLKTFEAVQSFRSCWRMLIFFTA